MTEKTLQKLFWAVLFSPQLRHSPQQPTNPNPSPQLPHSPLHIVTNLTAVFLAPLPWGTWILPVKDTPLEHPSLVLGYKVLCRYRQCQFFRSRCKSMSASPDNRSSDIPLKTLRSRTQRLLKRHWK